MLKAPGPPTLVDADGSQSLPRHGRRSEAEVNAAGFEYLVAIVKISDDTEILATVALDEKQRRVESCQSALPQ